MRARMDVVYTWVDGARPDYRTLLQDYSSAPVDLNPERYRDVYEMLRYSLRSVARYAPWIRRIFLFTCRPHVPEWLNLDHPDVHLHHHDEIFEDPGILPTFSCNGIETQLHRLPCSDPFLYMNDDYLFGAPVDREYLCDARGRIAVFGTLLGERFPWRIRDAGLSLGFTEHTPLWVVKRHWEASQQRFPEDLARTLRNRFRQPADLRMERLYRYYLLAHTRERKVVPFWQARHDVWFHKITNDLAAEQAKFARLRQRGRKLLCFNDDQRDNPNPEVVRLVRDYLAQSYPEPSPWEKS